MRGTTFLIAACAFGLMFVGFRASADPFILEPQLVYERVAEGALLIDVRTPHEVESGVIPGSILVPYDEIEERIGEISVEKMHAILVYCASGRRASKGAATLRGLGFVNVSNAGGYDELKEYWGEKDKSKDRQAR